MMGSRVAALAVWLLVPALAAAEAPRDCEQRTAWIQAGLARTAHRVRVWRWGWGIAGVASTAGQLAVAAVTDDRATRIDFLVGAASSLGLFVGPLWPAEVDERADPRAASCPDRLADAERRLAAAARSQRAARSPWLHVGNAAFNVGVGLLLGLGFDHWVSGAVNAAAGFAIGEAQLLTVPDGAARGMTELRGSPSVALVPLGLGDRLGVALAVRF